MSVLIKPIITEKATLGSELYNRYTFLVQPKANKVEIKKAVETAYGVNVEKVRTRNSGHERKMRYTKTGIQKGKTNATNKAIVQVAEGDAIDFYMRIQMRGLLLIPSIKPLSIFSLKRPMVPLVSNSINRKLGTLVTDVIP